MDVETISHFYIMPTDYEGWIWKQSNWFKQWKQKYMMLKGSKLYVSKDPSMAPDYTIDLTERTLVGSGELETSLGNETRFEVRGDDLLYVFRAYSQNLKDAWICAIGSAISSLKEDENGMVKLKHHPKYCRYFGLLQRLQEEREKLSMDGIDTEDLDPDRMICLDLNAPSTMRIQKEQLQVMIQKGSGMLGLKFERQPNSEDISIRCIEEGAQSDIIHHFNVGDKIISLNGVTYTNCRDLCQPLENAKEGDQLLFEIERATQEEKSSDHKNPPDPHAALNAALKARNTEKVEGKLPNPHAALNAALKARVGSTPASEPDVETKMQQLTLSEGAQAIFEDQKFKEYFQKIKFGQPLQAVMLQMSIKGIEVDSKIEDAFIEYQNKLAESKADSSDNDPARPAPEKMASMRFSTSMRFATCDKKATPVRQGPRRRKVQGWAKVTTDQDSVWDEINVSIQDLGLDDEEFKQLFVQTTAPAPAEAKEENKSTENPEMKTIIDDKLAFNIEVLVGKKYSPEQLRDALETCQHSLLDSVLLSNLPDHLPSDKELKEIEELMSSTKGSGETVRDAEKFMWGALREIENPGQILSILLYQRTFDRRIKAVESEINDLNAACEEVRNSRNLKVILGVIREVVNKINEEHVKGFSLGSLGALDRTKAYDKKTSVLVYIAKLILRGDTYTDFVDLKDGLHHVQTASRIHLEMIEEEMNKLHNGLENLQEFLEKRKKRDEALDTNSEQSESSLKDFAELAAVETKNLKNQVNKVGESFKGLLVYFSQREGQKPKDFFHTLQIFCESFERAIKEARIANGEFKQN